MNSPSDRDPGYLALLLERVLPGEPLLQRRQPALFEPVQARAGNWRHEAVAEVESAAPAPREHDRGDVVAQQAPWVRPPSPLPQEAPPRRSHELDAEAPPQATTGSSSRETVVRHETTCCASRRTSTPQCAS